MQRTFLRLALALAVASTACTLHTPVQLVPSTIPVDGLVASDATVEGRACQWFVIPFFTFGDNSLAAARDAALSHGQSAGLVDVAVDADVTHYFVAARRCTVVRGRPLYRPSEQDGTAPRLPGEESHDRPGTPRAAPAQAHDGPASADQARVDEPSAPVVDPRREAPSEPRVRAALAANGTRKLLKLCTDNFAGGAASLVLELQIAPAGRIVAVAAPGQSAKFVSCAEQSLRGVAFSPFDGAAVTVRVELH